MSKLSLADAILKQRAPLVKPKVTTSYGMQFRPNKTYYNGRVETDLLFNQDDPPVPVMEFQGICRRVYMGHATATMCLEWHKLSVFNTWWSDLWKEAHRGADAEPRTFTWWLGDSQTQPHHFAPDQGCWVTKEVAQFVKFAQNVYLGSLRGERRNLPGTAKRRNGWRACEFNNKVVTLITPYDTPEGAHFAWVRNRIADWESFIEAETLPRTKAMMQRRVAEIKAALDAGEVVFRI